MLDNNGRNEVIIAPSVEQGPNILASTKVAAFLLEHTTRPIDENGNPGYLRLAPGKAITGEIARAILPEVNQILISATNPNLEQRLDPGPALGVNAQELGSLSIVLDTLAGFDDIKIAGVDDSK